MLKLTYNQKVYLIIVVSCAAFWYAVGTGISYIIN